MSADKLFQKIPAEIFLDKTISDRTGSAAGTAHSFTSRELRNVPEPFLELFMPFRNAKAAARSFCLRIAACSKKFIHRCCSIFANLNRSENEILSFATLIIPSAKIVISCKK